MQVCSFHLTSWSLTRAAHPVWQSLVAAAAVSVPARALDPCFLLLSPVRASARALMLLLLLGWVLLVLNNLAPFYCWSRRKLAIFGGNHASSLDCSCTSSPFSVCLPPLNHLNIVSFRTGFIVSILLLHIACFLSVGMGCVD